MDFESIGFSCGMDNNGNPIWFAGTNVDIENFAFKQFLNNGNVLGRGWNQGICGLEIDLNGNIVYSTPTEYNNHHD